MAAGLTENEMRPGLCKAAANVTPEPETAESKRTLGPEPWARPGVIFDDDRFTRRVSFGGRPIVLIAAMIVLIPILTSRSSQPKNPADIES